MQGIGRIGRLGRFKPIEIGLTDLCSFRVRGRITDPLKIAVSKGLDLRAVFTPRSAMPRSVIPRPEVRREGFVRSGPNSPRAAGTPLQKLPYARSGTSHFLGAVAIENLRSPCGGT